MKYEDMKDKIRNESIEKHLSFTGSHSYNDLIKWNYYFTKMGKRYGLLKEFKENGII